VILVKDPDKRARVRDLYLPGWYQYLALRSAGLVPFSPVNDRDAERDALPNAAGIAERAQARGGGFAEHLDTAPALLVLLADLRQVAAMDRDADHYPVVGGGSVYPFGWSILLGAHERGLGGVMTTVTAREEKAMYELLGVPPELVFAGLIVLGYPKAPPPTRLARGAVAGFATVDSLDGPPLG
jgi:nitroreductase